MEKKWTQDEVECGEWFKNNYDSSAVVLGKSNAFQPDIISPLYGIGEIKTFPAQSSQFTKSTANKNKYSNSIMNKPRSTVTIEEATQWVKEQYHLKGVTFFIIKDNNQINYYSFDEFFQHYCAKLENRATKKSGSRSLPKFAYKYIPNNWNAEERNGHIYAVNTVTGEEHQYINTKGELTTMWVSPNTQEIRTLSNTNNDTWIFQLQKR